MKKKRSIQQLLIKLLNKTPTTQLKEKKNSPRQIIHHRPPRLHQALEDERLGVVVHDADARELFAYGGLALRAVCVVCGVEDTGDRVDRVGGVGVLCRDSFGIVKGVGCEREWK